MASITVDTTGYWGDDTILVSGSWAALAYGDTVTIQDGAVCTIDPDQQTPTGIDVGVEIVCSSGLSALVINNQSDAALIICGKSTGTFTFSNSCRISITGKKVNLKNASLTDWVSDGSPNQTIPSGAGYGWTGIGFDVLDYCSSIEVEEETDTWVKWDVIRADATADWGNVGVGALGRYCTYDHTAGTIAFGDNGKPESLVSDATSGQSYIDVADASNFSTSDIIHIIDDTGRTNLQRVEIDSISAGGGDGGSDRINLVTDTKRAFPTSANSLIRLTVGGSIPPSGANVRVSNICLSTVDSGGNRLNHAVSTNDLSVAVSNLGVVELSNCYFSAVKLNISSASSVTLNYYSGFRYAFFGYCDSAELNYSTFAADYFVSTTTFSIVLSNCQGLLMNYCHMVGSGYKPGVIQFAGQLTFNVIISFAFLEFIGASSTTNTESIIGYSGPGNNNIFKNSLLCGTQVVCAIDIGLEDCEFSASTNGLTRTTYASGSLWYTNGILTGVSHVFESGPGSSAWLFRSYRVYSCSYDAFKDYSIILFMSGSPAIIKRFSFLNLVQNFLTSTISSANIGLTVFDVFSLSDNKTIRNTFGYNENFYHVTGTVASAYAGRSKPGSHFAEIQTDVANNYGVLALLISDNTADNSHLLFSPSRNASTISGDTPSRLYITTDNGSVTWVWPHKILGVTGFRNVAPTIAGSGTGNFTIEFSINNGDWTELNQANIYAASYSGMEGGFDLSIRISKTTASMSNYINQVYIHCEEDFINNMYPLDTVNITLQNVVDGSRYYVYNETTDEEVTTGVQSGNSDIVIPDVPYNGSSETLTIDIRKATSAPLYKALQLTATLTENGANVYVSQVLDT